MARLLFSNVYRGTHVSLPSIEHGPAVWFDADGQVVVTDERAEFLLQYFPDKIVDFGNVDDVDLPQREKDFLRDFKNVTVDPPEPEVVDEDAG